LKPAVFSLFLPKILGFSRILRLEKKRKEKRKEKRKRKEKSFSEKFSRNTFGTDVFLALY